MQLNRKGVNTLAKVLSPCFCQSSSTRKQRESKTTNEGTFVKEHCSNWKVELVNIWAMTICRIHILVTKPRLTLACAHKPFWELKDLAVSQRGRRSYPRMVQHWKPWKPLNGHGDLAFYHPFLNYNMLHHDWFSSSSTQSILIAPRLKVRLSHSAPQSYGLPSKRACFRRGLMAATEFWHLFDTAGNWNLILSCRRQIICQRHWTSRGFWKVGSSNHSDGRSKNLPFS